MAASLAKGCDVTVATGSGRVPFLNRDITPIALPDLKAEDISFSTLVSPTGDPLDPSFWDDRAQRLLEGFVTAQPDILVVEGFPFARRRFRHELLPIIDHARSHNIPVICSLRDIIQPKGKPERLQEVVNWLNSRFNAVMIHGDPSLVTLDASFPPIDEIEPALIYTGYVNQGDAEPYEPSPLKEQRTEIVASAGGGAAGRALYEAAIAAAKIERNPDILWRILIGPYGDNPVQATDRQNLVIEPVRNDFQKLLENASLSISQAGYNTCVDLFRAKTPAILIPAAEGGQLEQTIRAELLAQFPGFNAISEDSVTAETLSEAVYKTLNSKKEIAFPQVDLDGANRTVDILTAIVRGGVEDAVTYGLG